MLNEKLAIIVARLLKLDDSFCVIDLERRTFATIVKLGLKRDVTEKKENKKDDRNNKSPISYYLFENKITITSNFVKEIFIKKDDSEERKNWVNNFKLIYHKMEKMCFNLSPLSSVSAKIEMTPERKNFQILKGVLSGNIDYEENMPKIIEKELELYVLQDHIFCWKGIRLKESELKQLHLAFKGTSSEIDLTTAMLKPTEEFMDYLNFENKEELENILELINLSFKI